MSHPSRILLTAITTSFGLAAASAAVAQSQPSASTPQAAPMAPHGAPPPHPPAGPGAGRGMPPPPDAGMAAATVTGRIAHWLPNPNGEVDGLLLDDGTQVAFPPHWSARVVGAFKLRDQVQVVGRRGAEGGVLRAASLRNAASGQNVADDGPDAPPRPSRPPRPPRDLSALTAMTASGRIATLLHTPRGDVSGVLVDDGTTVRFPPHVGRQMASSLKVGGQLFATGYGTRGAQGNAFEATRLGTSAGDAQAVLAGPRGDPLHRPGGAASAGRGPGAHGPHADTAPPPADGALPPQGPGPAAAMPPAPPARPDGAGVPR